MDPLWVVAVQPLRQRGERGEGSGATDKAPRIGEGYGVGRVRNSFVHERSRRSGLVGRGRIRVHNALGDAHASHLGGDRVAFHYELGGAAAEVDHAKRAACRVDVGGRAGERQSGFFLAGDDLRNCARLDPAKQFAGHGEEVLAVRCVAGGRGGHHTHAGDTLALHLVHVVSEGCAGALDSLGREGAGLVYALAEADDGVAAGDLACVSVVDEQADRVRAAIHGGDAGHANPSPASSRVMPRSASVGQSAGIAVPRRSPCSAASATASVPKRTRSGPSASA